MRGYHQRAEWEGEGRLSAVLIAEDQTFPLLFSDFPLSPYLYPFFSSLFIYSFVYLFTHLSITRLIF